MNTYILIGLVIMSNFLIGSIIQQSEGDDKMDYIYTKLTHHTDLENVMVLEDSQSTTHAASDFNVDENIGDKLGISNWIRAFTLSFNPIAVPQSNNFFIDTVIGVPYMIFKSLVTIWLGFTLFLLYVNRKQT